MKKNRKKIILLVAIIAIIILTVIIWKAFSKEEVPQEPTTNQIEEFVEKRENGQKVNTSQQVAQEKIVEELTIKEIKVTSLNNVTTITANVSNNTQTEKKGFYIQITAVNKNGEKIATCEGIIDTIQAGKTVTLNVRATSDFANAYDLQFSKIQDLD